MVKFALLLALALCVLSPPSFASEAAPAAEDPALEQRMTDIATELRCLVCQNQTIVESNAPLAVDLRNQIREQLKQGRSAEDVRSYMVERYGDFVLYRPPLKATTILLWIGPLLLFVAGLGVMLRKIRQRRAAAAPLTEDERRTAARLLSGGEAER